MAVAPLVGNSMTLSFPSIFVPEKEKDENYHKQFAQSITNRSVISGYYERNALMNECVNFYLGLQSGDEFEFLQKAEDGEVLPAKWMDFNKIAVKVDLLLGELWQRGYKINVKSYNKEAQSRKMEERNRLVNEMRFQPIAEVLEDEVGLPLQQEQGFIPQTNEELDIYMNKSYKEKSEIVMRAILSYLKKEGGWDYQRIALFRDLLIMGACFARNEIIDGIPSLTRVDPRNMIFDINSKDDYLSDSTFWGEVTYMSLGEVTKRYKITKQELEEAFKNYKDYMTNQTTYAAYQGDFGFMDRSSQLKIFDNRAGQLRVLVVKAFWQDFKSMAHRYEKDKYGQEHVVRKEDGSTGDNIKNTAVQMWRQAHLIGGKFVKEWGYMKNQDRSVDNIATTTPPYTSLIPNFLNGAIVSKVDRLKNLQKLKNISLYNLQVKMAQSGGKIFFYDVSQLPKGWDVTTAMKYARIAGIAFIDSSVEGAGPHNQFPNVDMGTSSAFNDYLTVSAFIDREMDSVSGVNEARQGLVQGASQAVGVTNSALLQSSLSTALYYNLFSGFFSKAMNKQAGLAKIAWAGKERFSPIIGDTGINFLEEDIGLELNDYNVFIEEVPPVLADQQLFYQLVMTAIQSGKLSFVSGLKLLLEKDMDEAVQTLELEVARQEQMQQQSQEQMMQQEQQLAEAQAQQQQAATQAKLQAQQMKGNSDIQKIIAQGRLDMKQGLMGFKQNLAMKKIDAMIQQQKNKEKAKPKK